MLRECQIGVRSGFEGDGNHETPNESVRRPNGICRGRCRVRTVCKQKGPLMLSLTTLGLFSGACVALTMTPDTVAPGASGRCSFTNFRGTAAENGAVIHFPRAQHFGCAIHEPAAVVFKFKVSIEPISISYGHKSLPASGATLLVSRDCDAQFLSPQTCPLANTFTLYG